MHIVIDLQGAQSSGSRNRGIGNYSEALALTLARLARGKHRVSLVLNAAFADTIDPIQQAFDGLIAAADFHIWRPLGPCHAHDLANAWRRDGSEALYAAFMSKLNADVLLIASLFEGFVDDAISALPGGQAWPPTAVVLYDLIPYIHPRPYLENPTVSAWYHGRIGRARQADLLLAISGSSAQEAIDYLGSDPERVVNISSAIDARFRVIAIAQDDADRLRARYGLLRPFVMYTGGIDHRKNIEGLIAAYASLPKVLRARHHLAVVCSINEDARQRLTALAARHGLGDDELVLTGYVPDDDLLALYNLCELFVFPSWHEGFGLPALEAMACGAPTLASNCSSLPEVVGWEEALFDPLKTRDIAKAITRGLTDTEFRKALSAHGLQQANKFSWEGTAQRALDALEKLHVTRTTVNPQATPLPAPFHGAKARLAYVSPLQSAQSGIADYSAELLPVLAAYYDIEVIVAQDEPVTDPWVLGNARQRSVAWFEAHVHEYDRILYHFGNSHFHQHMFELLERYPGVVVLHDFFLSGVQAYREATGVEPNAWTNALLHSHGWNALKHRFGGENIEHVYAKWPCNLNVLQCALGVVVHADYSRQLASHWYGAGYAEDWSVIPHLRVPEARPQRQAARGALGLREDDVLVCAFGLLGNTKLNHRLLDAWLASRLAQDPRARLVFVGKASGDYGAQIQQQLHAGHGRIHITGWADEATYRQYLAAADLAVQLRTLSRGETSGTVLDCMNYGIATIVNANGSMAQLPHDGVWMLEDDFNDDALIDALQSLRDDPKRRRQLGDKARASIRIQHQPRACAAQYFQAIEDYYARAEFGLPALERQLIRFGPAGVADLGQFAVRASELFPPKRPAYRQLLVDISELHQRDAKSGIQRVVRSVLHALLANPPEGFRVEPVYASSTHGYCYARRFTARFLGLGDVALDDEPVLGQSGDVFWGLDLQPGMVPHHQTELASLRLRGVKVVFTVYDLLPIMLPETSAPGVAEGHSRWLHTLTAVADGLISISAAVSNQLKQWLSLFGSQKAHAIYLGWAHLGADVVELAEDQPTWYPSSKQKQMLKDIGRHPAFLMVGTLEPRKAQAQALAAFDMLWNRGTEVNLVIVGKQGWLVEDLVKRLHDHPLRERHLFWLEGIEDALLEQVYATSTCLLAASLDEGFGLPLIEAARHGLPILARDIPVFREVADDHASYFVGTAPRDLADAVDRWLQRYRTGSVVQSDGMPWMNWAQATRAMLDVILHDNWQSGWQPETNDALIARYWGSDPRLGSIVGKRIGTELWSGGKAGHLLYGPFLEIKPGRYAATLHGRVGVVGLQGARADICLSGGKQVLLETNLSASHQECEQVLGRLEFVLDQPGKQLEVRVEVESGSDLMLGMIEIHRLDVAQNCKILESAPSTQREAHSPIIQEAQQDVLAYWATHAELSSAVSYADGRSLYTIGKHGNLLHGPYKNLPAGSYILQIYGSIYAFGKAWLDVVYNSGSTTIITHLFDNGNVVDSNVIANIELRLDSFVSDLEVRIFVSCETDMRVDGFTISRSLESCSDKIQNPIFYIEPGARQLHDSDLLKWDKGWSYAEDGHRWSEGYEAVLGFYLSETNVRASTGIKMLFHVHDEQNISFFLNGTFLCKELMTSASNDLILDGLSFQSGLNLLTIALPDAKHPGGGDIRILAIAIHEFEILAVNVDKSHIEPITELPNTNPPKVLAESYRKTKKRVNKRRVKL